MMMCATPPVCCDAPPPTADHRVLRCCRCPLEAGAAFRVRRDHDRIRAGSSLDLEQMLAIAVRIAGVRIDPDQELGAVAIFSRRVIHGRSNALRVVHQHDAAVDF